MDQEEYTRRFVAYMVDNAGFERFNCGHTVEEYAMDCAASTYDPRAASHKPEEDAAGDMEYWGEE